MGPRGAPSDTWVLGSECGTGVSPVPPPGPLPQFSREKPLPRPTAPQMQMPVDPCARLRGAHSPAPVASPHLSRAPWNQRDKSPNTRPPPFAGKTRRSVWMPRPLRPHWFAGTPRPAIGPCCARESRPPQAGRRRGLAAGRMTSGLLASFRAPFCVLDNLARN